MDDDNIALAACPFALNAKEPIADLKGQVIAGMLDGRTQYADP
jgi:hypothetical protein